jgi:hypothetical protein
LPKKERWIPFAGALAAVGKSMRGMSWPQAVRGTREVKNPRGFVLSQPPSLRNIYSASRIVVPSDIGTRRAMVIS